MSNAQRSLWFISEPVQQPPPSGTANETHAQIEELLDAFDGEFSLKHLFWELLSYDRVRDPLPLSILPPSAIKFMTSLEVFAATEVFTIVIAVVQYIPNDGSLEQMIWAVKRNIANCVVLLNEASTWSIIYPDEILKPRVRILPLPGPKDRRAEIVQALCALNAADDVSAKSSRHSSWHRISTSPFPAPHRTSETSLPTLNESQSTRMKRCASFGRSSVWRANTRY